ncbi:MAG: InlB B-repeat-containing protein [Clostridia bacterium]|nr:InlB B-repeat-containing protein [Clostridia bacterium]
MFKFFVKLVAVLIVLSLTFTGVSAVAAVVQTEDGDVTDISALPRETKDLPLLAILVNYDADGDGMDDWDSSDPTKLFSDPSAPYYGEQWALTDPSQFYSVFFSRTANSVTTFFNELTMGAINIVPAKITSPRSNVSLREGIVEVTVHGQHPTASGSEYNANRMAIEAADEYVDFSSFDTDGNKKLTQDELLIVIFHPGTAHEMTNTYTNLNAPRSYFGVHSSSQTTNAVVDGVSIVSGANNRAGRIVNMTEYSSIDKLPTLGTLCHELAHNFGALDVYDKDGDVMGDWPLLAYLSLQCNGGYSGGGASPTYLDPYQRIRMGWADSVTVGDGTYTIHSTLSGKYAVLRVNTPDPAEYFLIEIRLKAGFEKYITDAKTDGGIVIYHIDEDINDKYYYQGYSCVSLPSSGVRHDPGIYAMGPKGACYTKSSDFTRIVKDAFRYTDYFYYAGGTASHASCDTYEIGAAATGSHGLNSYPSGWVGEKYFNLHVEVLSPAGDDMTVRITTESHGSVLPAPTATATLSYDSVTVTQTVKGLDTSVIECGVECSATGEFDGEQLRAVGQSADIGEQITVTGLQPETRYYVRSYYATEQGTVYSSVITVRTAAVPLTRLVVVGAETETEPTEIRLGEKYTVPVPLAREGMEFAGWYADEDMTVPFDFDAAATVKGDVMIYAKWNSVTVATTVAVTEAASSAEATTSAPTGGGCSATVGIGSCAVLAVAMLGMCALIGKRK